MIYPFLTMAPFGIILASHRWLTSNLIYTQSPDLYSIMNHMIILCMLLPSFNLLGINVLGNVVLGHHIIWWNILIPCVTLPCKINSQFLFSLPSLFHQVSFLTRWYHQTRRALSHMMLYMKVLLFLFILIEGKPLDDTIKLKKWLGKHKMFSTLNP